MEAQSQLVSIIIPAYNRANLISRAIESILNQTYQNLEIIIVDDGSTDNTEQIVKSYSDKRIRYIKHEKNQGGAAARNTGIKTAAGKYIAFQDSDDEWLPEKLEKQMKAFEKTPPEVGVIYTEFWKVKDNVKTHISFPKIRKKEGDIYKILLEGNFVALPSAVLEKTCFRKAGLFDERLPRLQDWELFIRISKHYHFKCVEEPLVISYHQKDGISANQDALIKAQELILEKHYEELRKEKELLIKHHIIISDLLISNGEMKKGRRYLINAIKIQPSNIKLLCAAFLTFFGQRAYNRIVRIYQKTKSIGL